MINFPTDGLYPELIVLFRAVASYGPVDSEELISVCSSSNPMRLRGALSRWTQLGLFVGNEKSITLDSKFGRRRSEPIDLLTERLPGFCRELIFLPINALPLWGEDAGPTADFTRGIAWLLAQNIYGFPTTWDDGAEREEQRQITGGRAIVRNDTRWNGLRFWARYLGFATGDSGSFLIDPTAAVSAELSSIFGKRRILPATDFIQEVQKRLPVLDFGVYRVEVESALNEEAWRRPSADHLSMSLSLALRRLQLANTIALDTKADTGQGFSLTGKDYRSWDRFTHVRLAGEKA